MFTNHIIKQKNQLCLNPFFAAFSQTILPLTL